MLFCAMDSIIYAMLLTYCAFAYLGFPRGPWSSNIFTNHKSRWSWTYTHQGSSCDSCWSCLESKVPEWQHILIKSIPFVFTECLSLQVFFYNTIFLFTVRTIRVLIGFTELDRQKMWLYTAWWRVQPSKKRYISRRFTYNPDFFTPMFFTWHL